MTSPTKFLRFLVLVLLVAVACAAALQHECQHDAPAFQRVQSLLNEQPPAPQRYHDVTSDERDFHAFSVGSIRFAISYLDLQNASHYCTSVQDVVPDMQGGNITCGSSNILTAAKNYTLINYIIPAALSRLSGAISVDQIQGNLMVPSTSACGSPWTIPSAHVSTGIANADYVVYVSAAPTSGNVIAWAGYCSKDQNGRPFVGRMNFNPAYISWNTTDMSQNQLPYNTLTHELTHALGFSYTFATTGFKSGVNVVNSTTVRDGQPAKIITSAKVLAAGKTYFGCSTIAGVELEDEGSSGTVNSHWERRNLMQELMAGMTTSDGSSGSRMSVMTLSYLEDTGYYYIDYTKADAMQYGNNQGCSFLQQKCNSTSPQMGTYWCNDTSSTSSACTWNLHAVGYCATGTYSSAFPSYWQYFSNPNIGGTTPLVDYCPMVQGYSNTLCTNVSYQASDTETILGYSYAANSRCFITSDTYIDARFTPSSDGSARCIHTRCPNGTRLQISGDNITWSDCPRDGSAGNISAPSGFSGWVLCPAAALLCSDVSLYYAEPVATSSPTNATTTSTAAPSTTAASNTTAAANATTTAVVTTTATPLSTTSVPSSTTSNSTAAPPTTTASQTSSPTTTTSSTSTNSTSAAPSSTPAPNSTTATASDVATTNAPLSTSNTTTMAGSTTAATNATVAGNTTTAAANITSTTATAQTSTSIASTTNPTLNTTSAPTVTTVTTSTGTATVTTTSVSNSTTAASTTTPAPTSAPQTSAPNIVFSCVVATTGANAITSAAALQLRIATRLNINTTDVVIDSFNATTGAGTFRFTATASALASQLANDTTSAATTLGFQNLSAAVETPTTTAAPTSSDSGVPVLPIAIAIGAALVLGVIGFAVKKLSSGGGNHGGPDGDRYLEMNRFDRV